MRRVHKFAAVAAACAIAGSAQALSFGEALQAALKFDGQFQASGHELASARESVPIARASLLPSVTLSAARTNVTGSREFPNSLNQQVQVPVDYAAPQYNLQLRTPLFNYEAFSRYRQAGAQLLSAESLYEVRRLELAERTGAAYLQALLAHENAGLAKAELESLQAQQQRAEQRLLRGEGTRTEVAQTQASVDVARVRLLEAQDVLAVALRALRRNTGVETVRLNNLDPAGVLAPLAPMNLQDWIDRAESNSPLLRTRRSNIQAASFNVDRNRAAHLPRLDLVAGVSRSRNESVSNLNQQSSLRSIGIQLNVPLYSGGGIDASVRQALAERARAEEELRVEREAVQLEVLRQYAIVANADAKIEAYRQALNSSEVAVEGITKALAAGLATTADVIDAQSRRYAAQRDLAQARYEVLAARMRLMMQAGLPVTEVAADLDRALTVDSPLNIRPMP